VTDEYGVTGQATGSLEVLSDEAIPAISIHSPANNSIVNGTVRISGTASDNREVLSVEYRIDGKGNWLQARGSDSWFFDLDTTELENGKRTLELRAYDGKHYSEEVSIIIEVDNGEEDEKPVSDTDILLMVLVLPALIITVLTILFRYRDRLTELFGRRGK
jgi:hypothetical protein